MTTVIIICCVLFRIPNKFRTKIKLDIFRTSGNAHVLEHFPDTLNVLNFTWTIFRISSEHNFFVGLETTFYYLPALKKKKKNTPTATIKPLPSNPIASNVHEKKNYKIE